MGLEEKVAEDDIDGQHGEARFNVLFLRIVAVAAVEHTGRDAAVSGHGGAAELHHFRCQGVADALHVLHLVLAVGLADADQRSGIEGHLAVVLGQLHVSPCTDGQSLSILGNGHHAATCTERGVAVGDEVVAVVDDAVVEVGRVVLVGGVGGEVGQASQVGLGVAVGGGKVTTHLASHDILVGQLLQSLQDTEGVEHGVGLLVECRVENLTVAVGLEHVLTGGEDCGGAAT